MHYISISTYQFILYYASTIHKHTHASSNHMRTLDGAKNGYCPKLNIILIYYVLVPEKDNFLFSLSSGTGLLTSFIKKVTTFLFSKHFS